MTERRHYLQDRQRDQRRRRDAQRLGKLFADAVRERREAREALTGAPPDAPQTGGSRAPAAAAGPSDKELVPTREPGDA